MANPASAGTARRQAVIAGLAAAAVLPAVATAKRAEPARGAQTEGGSRLSTTSVRDGTQIYFKEGMLSGHKNSFDCIKAFSETDFTADLKKFDVPSLILHGDDDQVVPFADSAPLSAKLVKGSQLKVYKGGSHGICSVEKDRVNADLLEFFKSSMDFSAPEPDGRHECVDPSYIL